MVRSKKNMHISHLDNITKFDYRFLWIHYSDPHGPYSPPGEPPDLNIHLNDVFQKKLCLDKNEIENPSTKK